MLNLSRTKIKLVMPENIIDFVNMCSKYEWDVNIYDGSTVVDAKSVIGVFSIPQGKVIEVQAITSDERVVIEFLEKKIRKFCGLRKCPHLECLIHHKNAPFGALIRVRKFTSDKDWNCKAL